MLLEMLSFMVQGYRFRAQGLGLWDVQKMAVP